MRAWALVLILFAAGCGPNITKTPIDRSGGQGQTPAGGAVDPQALRLVNESLTQIQQAERLAFAPSAANVNLPPEQKVEHLRAALAASGQCAHGAVADLGGPGQRDFSHDWQYDWYVSNEAGQNCALEFSDMRTFQHGANLLHVSQALDLREDMHPFNGVWSMRADGTLAATAVKGARRLSGSFTYKLQVDGLAASLLTLSVRLEHARSTGDGIMRVTVQLGSKQSLVQAAWDGHGKWDYRYDGQILAEKDFAEMFSALGLTEFIDNAKEM